MFPIGKEGEKLAVKLVRIQFYWKEKTLCLVKVIGSLHTDVDHIQSWELRDLGDFLKFYDFCNQKEKGNTSNKAGKLVIWWIEEYNIKRNWQVSTFYILSYKAEYSKRK